jgi:sugar lactone lactonase YvrE
VGRPTIAACALPIAVWASCNVYTPELLTQGALVSTDGGLDAQDEPPPPIDDGGGVDVPGEDGCAPGLGRCGASTCNINFKADPKNCGACGHDCLGGTCFEGDCQPVLVAGQQSEPAYVALDATHVYWTNSGNGTVWRANKDGTNAVPIAQGQASPWVIRVRNGRVYWTQDTGGGFVASAPADGSGPVFDLSGPQPSPRGIDVDDTYVYFDTEDQDAGTMRRVQLDGGGLTTIASQQGSPKDLIVTPTSVLWANHDDGTIARYDVASAAFAPLEKQLPAPWGLGWDGTFLYWTCRGTTVTADSGSIGRVALDGSQKTTLAEGLGAPRAIAVDANYMYFTNELEGTVKRVPPGGGAVTTIAAGQVQPWGIAIDDQFVYWAAKGGGNVLKVAK